jgi:Gpi18-like mannosyltransferase
VGFLFLAFLLRWLCLPYETLDYQDFLAGWVDFFRLNGGFLGLDRPVGNYNVPYLYFLALFSYSDMGDLYLIKLLSIFFDVVLAWGCLRIVSLFTPREGRRLFVFLGVLLLPTGVRNGARWGPCARIYVAFGIWAVYEALNEKPFLSVVFAALAFSFKLQAVFFLPAFAVLLFTKRMKWRDLLAFPLTYLLVVLPAVLLGRPLLDTITLYIDQAGSVGSGLNYNSPSLYAFIPYGAVVDTALSSSAVSPSTGWPVPGGVRTGRSFWARFYCFSSPSRLCCPICTTVISSARTCSPSCSARFRHGISPYPSSALSPPCWAITPI